MAKAKPAKKEVPKPSLDEAIGKGLTPQGSSSDNSDYANHPKFAKFIKKGAN